MLPRGFQFVGLMLKAGLLVLPEDDGPDFRETKGALRTAWREFQAFQARSPIWRLALMAVLYTVGFMVVRLLLTQAMGIFQNVWIAGGHLGARRPDAHLQPHQGGRLQDGREGHEGQERPRCRACAPGRGCEAVAGRRGRVHP